MSQLPFRRRRLAAAVVLAATLASSVPPADAFCGFFVGKADAALFNHASQVIVARHEKKTVISMLNDYQGTPAEFALVVPVPEVLQKDQIHIGDRRVFERLDAFSAPRLVEYHDSDPCAPKYDAVRKLGALQAAAPAAARSEAMRDKALGVTVEARYTVGEYDIAILSAKESGGLETWLVRNGYRMPRGAAAALQPYVRQKLKFFVAKVNLAEHAKTGNTWLSPLQFAFESEKFMLPVRLGMLNADGPQDLVVYLLTQTGRVETTNYRNARVPTGVELPTYVRGDFAPVYRAMFDRQAAREDLRAVFTEFFWDMSWCDPCAADPLDRRELRQAGAFWIDPPSVAASSGPVPAPVAPGAPPPVVAAPPAAPAAAMLTRLHLRYTAASLPEDLMFQETQDRQPFQARYVLRHPWQGERSACVAAGPYFDAVRARQEREATALAELTGWSVDGIRAKMSLAGTAPATWWQTLWPEERR